MNPVGPSPRVERRNHGRPLGSRRLEPKTSFLFWETASGTRAEIKLEGEEEGIFEETPGKWPEITGITGWGD